MAAVARIRPSITHAISWRFGFREQTSLSWILKVLREAEVEEYARLFYTQRAIFTTRSVSSVYPWRVIRGV